MDEQVIGSIMLFLNDGLLTSRKVSKIRESGVVQRLRVTELAIQKHKCIYI